MEDRKRRRSSESADDIERICLSKKQNLAGVNTALKRSSSAPGFSCNKKESIKLLHDSYDRSSTSSNTGTDSPVNTAGNSSMLSQPHENIQIPTNLPIETRDYGRNSTNKDSVVEEENHGSRQRVDSFKMALERIEDLQQSLYDDDSDDDFDLKDHLEGLFGPDTAGIPQIDPQTLGFLMCAQETMKYLFEHGIKKDNPIVINLRDRLIQGIQQI